MTNPHTLASLGFLLAGIVIGCTLTDVISDSGSSGAGPQDSPGLRSRMLDPNGTVSNRFCYYPGTEALGPDDVRITACGTGMPASRRGQAAACFVVELGNGDKFLFDVGTGSMANVMSLNIPADFLKLSLIHI